MRPYSTRRHLGHLWVATHTIAAVACYSPAAYTRGDLLDGALPEPEVTVTVRARWGASQSLAAPLDLSGRLLAAERLRGLGPGFRLLVRRADGVTMVVSARTFAEGVPDIAPGTPVTIQVRPGPLLRVDDDLGPVALLYSGVAPPPLAEKDPVLVRGTSERVFVEVSSSEDLCRWTHVHGFVEVESADGERRMLRPGESAILTALGRHWRVVAGDWRIPEESDCEARGEPRLRFMWWRSSPGRRAKENAPCAAGVQCS